MDPFTNYDFMFVDLISCLLVCFFFESMNDVRRKKNVKTPVNILLMVLGKPLGFLIKYSLKCLWKQN